MKLVLVFLFYEKFFHSPSRHSLAPSSWKHLVKNDLYQFYHQTFEWAERLGVTIGAVEKIERTLQDLKISLLVVHDELMMYKKTKD